jgi:hypothetical protein
MVGPCPGKAAHALAAGGIFALALIHSSMDARKMDREELIDELFAEFDTNRDGELSRGEFVDLVKYLIGEHGIGVSSKIFEEFDANHDGRISRDELRELVIQYAL